MDQRNFLQNVLEFIQGKRIQAILKPLLLSSSLCQRIHPSIDCPLQSITKLFLQFLDQIVKSYCSAFFSRNWRVMSQRSGHEFWHFKTTTIERLWINVYELSFRNGNIDIWIHSRSWLWFSLCHKFPCDDGRVNILTWYFLWRFCDVLVDTIHNANPRNRLLSKQWFDHDSNAITLFVTKEIRI